MKLTAHELALIIDTLNHSLMVANWSGCYTAESRENVRNTLGMIMGEMSVEIVTQSPDPVTITSDMGV
jgi:hypothetical protein